MSRRLRRTKIVTTLGPATDRDNNLEKIIAAGANVVRMNFSHGTPEDHKLRADKVREIAAKLGRHVAILGDCRVQKFVFQPSKKVKSSSISVINSCSMPTWVKAKAIKKKLGSTIKVCRLSCAWRYPAARRRSRSAESAGSSGMKVFTEVNRRRPALKQQRH